MSKKQKDKPKKKQSIFDDDDILRGANAIADYLGCGLTTFITRVNNGLPARKLPGECVWYASKREIDEWFRSLL